MSEEPEQPESDSPPPVELTVTEVSIRQQRVFPSAQREQTLRRMFSHFWREKRFAWLCMGFALLVLDVFDFHGWLGGLEGFGFDLFQKAGSLVRPSSPDAAASRLVLIDVDEKAYRNFFGCISPLESRLVLTLVDYARSHGAAVVAVDLVAAYPDYTKGGQTLSDPRVVWSAEARSVARQLSFWEWVSGHEEPSFRDVRLFGEPVDNRPPPPPFWGIPAYPRDEDFRVRRVRRFFQWDDSRHPLVDRLPTLPYQTGQIFSLRMNRTGPGDFSEAMITKNASSRPTIEASEILKDSEPASLKRCGSEDKGAERVSAPAMLTPALPTNQTSAAPLDAPGKSAGAGASPPDFEGKIVLIGGTYEASRDFHETSYGEMSGLLINANAIEAELEGNVLVDTPKWLLLLIDIGAGSGVMFGLWRWPSKTMRGLILRGLIVGSLFYVAGSALLYAARFLWVSWMGGVIGIALGSLADEWVENRRFEGH